MGPMVFTAILGGLALAAAISPLNGLLFGVAWLGGCITTRLVYGMGMTDKRS